MGMRADGAQRMRRLGKLQCTEATVSLFPRSLQSPISHAHCLRCHCGMHAFASDDTADRLRRIVERRAAKRRPVCMLHSQVIRSDAMPGTLLSRAFLSFAVCSCGWLLCQPRLALAAKQEGSRGPHGHTAEGEEGTNSALRCRFTAGTGFACGPCASAVCALVAAGPLSTAPAVHLGEASASGSRKAASAVLFGLREREAEAVEPCVSLVRAMAAVRGSANGGRRSERREGKGRRLGGLTDMRADVPLCD
jgi:hypothetical protein